MAKLFNRAKMTTATTGSGTVTLGSASNGFQTFAAAGVLNGDVVQYVIEEGANFEIGTGTYSSTGTSLTRSPTESSNSNAAITLAGQATVSITAVADDLNRLQHGGSDKVTVSSTGASVTGNLAVSGTVDGRDVASDGSKLDGIESGATGDQTASEIRALVESASDSNVFTDADHSKLNGIEAGATGDQTNAEIRAAVEAATDSNVFTDADHTKLNGIEANATADQTITAGGGLTGGGTGNVTISHSDTSSQASVNGSGRTYIQDITLDTYGHVTGLATATETVVNTDTNTIPNNATITLSAGGALTGGGDFTTDQSSNETITFSHSDTSSQGSVNNSSGTVIQDVTLDGYGHVTGLASVNLDGRYFTETESDDRFVRKGVGYTWTAVGASALSFRSNDTIDTATGDQAALEIYQDNSGHDAFIQFHVAGDYGKYLGLHGGVNDFVVGGWSHGASYQRLFHDGYHPNADKWTSSRTLSLTGDVTGSVSWDGSGNASLSTTVGNDSHTHSQVAGLNVHTGRNNEANKVVRTQANGYVDFGWINTTSGTAGTIDRIYCSQDAYIRYLTPANFRSQVTDGYYNNYTLPAGPSYIDVATGNYGTVKVDDDRSVTWGGYAIRDDWVFMANGADQSGIYNDTDNEWAITFHRNAETRLYHNGSESLRTIGINGIRVGAPTHSSSDIYMSDSNEGERRIHCNSNRIGFLNSSNGWGSYCEDAGHWVVAGNITASGNVNSQSDVRVKKNIEPISDAMQKVQSINGVTFNRNDLDDTETRYVGVIAQDVEAVLPEAVSENGEGIKQVAYGNMVGLLIEAIKEQQTQIDDLKAEIQSMKS